MRAVSRILTGPKSRASDMCEAIHSVDRVARCSHVIVSLRDRESEAVSTSRAGDCFALLKGVPMTL